jgi:stage V sporulation protein SpoVS
MLKAVAKSLRQSVNHDNHAGALATELESRYDVEVRSVAEGLDIQATIVLGVAPLKIVRKS